MIREMIRTFILKLTHKIWNDEISFLLQRAYEKNGIDSKQLHELSAMFDPSQDHLVGKIKR